MISIRFAAAACVIAALATSTALARPPEGATLNRNILLIKFHEQALARYNGGVDGIPGTSRSATGQRLDIHSANSQAYLAWLHGRQDDHLAAISSALGRQAKVVFRYDIIMNGVAIRAQAGDYARISKLAAIKALSYDINYPLNTDRGPQWIGAPGVWDGSGTGGLGSTKGEGVLVGDLDTGINFGHPSYSDSPADGHTFVNPFGQDTFVGWCDPGNDDYDPTLECNNKLVGAWDFADAASGGIEMDGPVDTDPSGHGSHTSSTAAGNTLTSPAISGVAPHANIIMYDTCYVPAPEEQGTCPFSATSAAAQQALIDGVDVINYSIGGGGIPWSEFDIDSYFLDLVANGVFVSASAGNAGPAAATVGHNGPWVATNGASTHDREGVENMLIDMSGGTSPPADITGQSRTSGYGPAPVVYAGDYDNGDPQPAQCFEPFPPDTWTGGEIVLCDRGTIARVLKCANVAAGGAAGCILANADGGQTAPVADPHVIPAIHVNFADGNTLRGWLASGSGHMATITESTIIVNPAVGDIMGDFSSRGPSPFNVIKPDLTNPGVNIFAAVLAGGIPGFPGPDFGVLSGTSMSSPHTAGSAALLMSLHPSWTPPEVKSALMTTADTTVLKENGSTPANPFDRGAGRVQLGPASQAGLVLNESEANFLAANPATGGDTRTLNIASMQNQTCAGTCYFTRTVRNARSFTTNWTFSDTSGPNVSMSATPPTFSLASGATQEIEFAVTITGGAGFVFGEGTFTEDGALAPPAHFAAAVQAADLDAAPVAIATTMTTGSYEHMNLVSTGASDLQLSIDGLAPLNRSSDEVEQDPDNRSPYDNDLGTVTYWLNGVTNGRRIHASTGDSEAPDLDLFVGRDVNMNGIPELNEEVCSSTTPSANEKCEVFDPVNGNWWIRVQNWQGSGAPLDAFTAHFGVVESGDANNLDVTPSDASPASGQQFSLTFDWDFPAGQGFGDYIGVLDMGSSPGNPDDIGTLTIDFHNDQIGATGFE